jgi:hypothetical protein
MKIEFYIGTQLVDTSPDFNAQIVLGIETSKRRNFGRVWQALNKVTLHKKERSSFSAMGSTYAG